MNSVKYNEQASLIQYGTMQLS